VWGELRRRTHIELAWAFLPGHKGRIEHLGGGRRRIVLDATLDQRERRATLAHELVHDERDLWFTDDTPLGIVLKEEAIVEAEAVRRLVPLDQLDELVRKAVLNDGCVTWRDVADWFDVPRDVAEASMRQLQQRSRAAHPSRHQAA
jgi:hypothetical protein